MGSAYAATGVTACAAGAVVENRIGGRGPAIIGRR
jgi:hypothetical protein